MWIPYGTAERGGCHCQQDTALHSVSTLGWERVLHTKGLWSLLQSELPEEEHPSLLLDDLYKPHS